MSTVNRINEQTGKLDQPHALSDEAELCRARLRTAATCGYTVSLNVPEVKQLLAILDAHANDLADMQRAVEQIEEVYYHITGGQLSKWQTDPVYIKQAHDDACERAAQDALAEAIAELSQLEANLREEQDEPPANLREEGWRKCELDTADNIAALIAELRRAP